MRFTSSIFHYEVLWLLDSANIHLAITSLCCWWLSESLLSFWLTSFKAQQIFLIQRCLGLKYFYLTRCSRFCPGLLEAVTEEDITHGIIPLHKAKNVLLLYKGDNRVLRE